jgi:hypothetical protein
MSDIIRVGAKVRLATWSPDEYVTVTAVGQWAFLAVPSWDDYEGTYDLASNWLPYVAVEMETP